MTNAGYAHEELLAAMPNDALALVIDLGGCRYLDSAALEVIFDLLGAWAGAVRSCAWWCQPRPRSPGC